MTRETLPRTLTDGPNAQAQLTLPDFGGGLSEEFTADYGDVVFGMLAARASARLAILDGLTMREQRGEVDPRMVGMRIGRPEGPFGLFLVNKALCSDIRKAVHATYDDSTCNTLAAIAVANADGAVRPDFTPDAINAINASYFRSPVAFAPEAGLASIFSEGLTVNVLLGIHVAAQAGRNGLPIRVKELCTGGKADHWELRAAGAAALGAAKLEVVATDLTPPALPAKRSPMAATILDITSEAYSLFDDLPELPPAERFDAMMATYGFDSVWHPADIRLTRKGDRWFQSLYRVKVDDWNKRKDELLEALRWGGPLPNATPKDYEGIFVEEVQQEIDISGHPWEDGLREQPNGTICIPGGLITRVVQAFERQLGPDGIFVSADVADMGPCVEPGTASFVSGVAARYKTEDYLFAQRVLERRYGISVHFTTLPELVVQHLPDDWESMTEPREAQTIKDNMIVLMTARRALASQTA